MIILHSSIFPLENNSLPSSFSRRIFLIGVFLFFAFSLLWGRLGWIAFHISPQSPITLNSCTQPRADLVDRNGIILATSISTFSVYANPSMIKNKEEIIQHLLAIFPTLNKKTLKKKLYADKSFVWLIRHISPHQKLEVKKLGFYGISLMKDHKRIYPHDNLFCHILGMVDIDQDGISGLEKSLNASLKNKNSAPVKLSLDVRLQHAVRCELFRTIDSFQAKGGNAILIDIETGNILSMVSLPDFSLQSPPPKLFQAMFNRNVSGVYEFGSIMKIHNTAMVLENKVATLNSMYDASHPLKIGRFKITDFKGKNRLLSVKEAFLYSSNIANAKMALDAGTEKQVAFFKKLGFFSQLKTELPESARSLIPQVWSCAQTITASYGYGLAVTPLHMAQSIASLVSGHTIPLTFLSNSSLQKKEKVISPDTACKIRHLLFLATIEGQAKKAAAKGYEVGAKSGTANIRINGHYKEKQNLTSCVCVFPAYNPKYLLLVCVDQAKANASTHNFATAGWIAAPLASSLVTRLAPILELAPSYPLQKNTDKNYCQSNILFKNEKNKKF